MKATTHTIPAAAHAERSRFSLLADLFKARLTTLVLLTTLVGFYVAYKGPVDYLLMFNTMLGTALVASAAAALNQLWERQFDARMRRTQDRPLPSGRMQPYAVKRIGLAMGLAGLAYLALTVNLVTAAIGACTIVLYLFLYTPLKRVTWLNTLVGAVPGGLPPLMGWTAARGTVDLEGVLLFAILAFWQIPHFMAIAWIYRDEYAKAGFKMLPVIEPDGRRTARQALVFTVGLLPLALAPFLVHLAGPIYCAGALALTLLFLYHAVQFARVLSLQRARQLFYVSIVYLPLVLILMVIDKTK